MPVPQSTAAALAFVRSEDSYPYPRPCVRRSLSKKEKEKENYAPTGKRRPRHILTHTHSVSVSELNVSRCASFLRRPDTPRGIAALSSRATHGRQPRHLFSFTSSFPSRGNRGSLGASLILSFRPNSCTPPTLLPLAHFNPPYPRRSFTRESSRLTPHVSLYSRYRRGRDAPRTPFPFSSFFLSFLGCLQTLKVPKQKTK